MRIAVIIVNYKTPELAQICIEAICDERFAQSSIYVVVADNHSNDGSIEKLTAFINRKGYSEWIKILPLFINGGFGWANNQAILYAIKNFGTFDGFFLINPDARIERGALTALVRHMESHPDAGAVGSQLINQDGSLSGSAFKFPSIRREFIRGLGIGIVGRLLGIAPMVCDVGVEGPVDWVTGASVLLRTEALTAAGLFDTGFFLYFEEVELMHRLLRSGWRSYSCAKSRVLHIAGASTGVVNGQSSQNNPPPDYIYESRKRYFALTGSLNRAFIANMAWLAGDSIGRIVCWILPKRNHPNRKSERVALLRTGLAAGQYHGHPCPSFISDRIGSLPAWMKMDEN